MITPVDRSVVEKNPIFVTPYDLEGSSQEPFLGGGGAGGEEESIKN